jgi:hypothetical protein
MMAILILLLSLSIVKTFTKLLITLTALFQVESGAVERLSLKGDVKNLLSEVL